MSHPPFFYHSEMTDSERDARTEIEWQESVLSYINFRMGDAWRRLHRPGQRFHDVRQHWLEVYRTCAAAFRSTVSLPAAVDSKEGVAGHAAPSDRKPPQAARLAAALKRAKGAGK